MINFSYKGFGGQDRDFYQRPGWDPMNNPVPTADRSTTKKPGYVYSGDDQIGFVRANPMSKIGNIMYSSGKWPKPEYPYRGMGRGVIGYHGIDPAMARQRWDWFNNWLRDLRGYNGRM